jgi:ankyrin repeat protein
LHQAAGSENPEIIRILLSKKPDLNARTTAGFTPLHVAISQKRIGSARELIAAGADLTVKNNAGQTPREYAEAEGTREIAELLRKAEK